MVANQGGGKKYKRLVKACKELELGDTQEQVHQVMGQPAETKIIELNGRKVKRLGYSGPALAPMLPEILINPDSHRVERIICDDEYTLIDKIQNDRR
ncbi:hypothetical protein [Candidatus Manganitrophus noduliformans]|uniref:Uncharacterized protein n=1 Tax=Candidatus Manganitrophus noduliformans TaxID=2606439 RepID=A0A7X6IBD1_9BACT|nr:hypothetical protein [Candidatus Manganitrophus noduliformans]NKE71335.1 hypothetical protein [Candidatus Manganitrophus noduliformans]